MSFVLRYALHLHLINVIKKLMGQTLDIYTGKDP